MSTRELRRAGILARVAAGTLPLRSASVLMAVSYRQAKRLSQRYPGGGGERAQASERRPRVESGGAIAAPDAGVGTHPEKVRRER